LEENMKIKATLLVALSGIVAGCGTVSADLRDRQLAVLTMDGADAGLAPAPAGEIVGRPSRPFADLPTLAALSIVDGGNQAVERGRFVGNLEVRQRLTRVVGKGFGQTVIDGNLIVGSQCRVAGLTVTGDVLFAGNNAYVDVECLGQVIDYGLHNRH